MGIKDILVPDTDEINEEILRKFVNRMFFESDIEKAADNIADSIISELGKKMKNGQSFGEKIIENLKYNHLTAQAKELEKYYLLHVNNHPELEQWFYNCGLVRTKDEYYWDWEICFVPETRWQKLLLSRVAEKCEKEQIKIYPLLQRGVIRYQASKELLDYAKENGIQMNPIYLQEYKTAEESFLQAKKAAQNNDLFTEQKMYNRAARCYERIGFTKEASEIARQNKDSDWAIWTTPDSWYMNKALQRMQKSIKSAKFDIVKSGYDPVTVDDILFDLYYVFYYISQDQQSYITVLFRIEKTILPTVDYGYDPQSVNNLLSDIKKEFVARYKEKHLDYTRFFPIAHALERRPQKPHTVCIYCGSKNIRKGLLSDKCKTCGKGP